MSSSDRRINIDHRYERAYWSFVFGVSQHQLREAVRKAGVMAKDVERELKGSGRPCWKPTAPDATASQRTPPPDEQPCAEAA